MFFFTKKTSTTTVLVMPSSKTLNCHWLKAGHANDNRIDQ